jgi:hypothetical protein
MKRQRLLCLAVVVGMALLAAKPGYGDDKNVKTVTNIKKPAADVKKPASDVGKPAPNSEKTSGKKDRQMPNTVLPIANTKPAATAKPAPSVKPVASAKPAPIAKPAPKVSTAANPKPASIVKPLAAMKAVAAVKQATIVKPVTNAKTVASGKPVITSKPALIAKPATPNAKPAAIPLAKATSNSNRVINNKVDAKPAASIKMTPKAKPIVNSKPVTKVALAAAVTKPQPVKQQKINKPPVVTASAKMMATRPAQNGSAVSVQLPANFEKMNLTSDQRAKAGTIMDKYAVQIRDLESRLNDMKASRDKELSALLAPQKQTQLTKTKGGSQSKPSTKVGPTPSAATTGQLKSPSNKTSTVKRDNATASAAPMSKNKVAKKTNGQK